MLQPRKVTYAEYCTWTDPRRFEIIDGHPYLMSPAPRLLHQALVGSFHAEFRRVLGNQRCRAYVSPVDVKLSEWDVVQPDVVVVCNREQRRDTHIEGPPALVVEVLSPSTGRHDRVRKLQLYARHGVREYWLVTPEPPMLEVLVLDGDEYRIAGTYFDRDGRVQSRTLPLLDFELAELFEPTQDLDIEEVREAGPAYSAGS